HIGDMVSCRRFANRLFGQRTLHVSDIFDKIKTAVVNARLKQRRFARVTVCKSFISNAKAIAHDRVGPACPAALRSARLCAWIASEASGRAGKAVWANRTCRDGTDDTGGALMTLRTGPYLGVAAIA